MITVLPIDFMGQGALLEPVDRKLHDMAVEYCGRELEDGKQLNLAKFAKCWVIVLMDGQEYKEVLGFSGYVNRLDIPVFRVTKPVAGLLIDRMRAFFQDNGIRGAEVFLHLSSKERPEQKCAEWQKSLVEVGAVPADRYTVKV